MGAAHVFHVVHFLLFDTVATYHYISQHFKPKGGKQKGRGTRLGNATYVMEKRLPETLKKQVEKARAPAMLDYVLMSCRYRSSMSDAKVKWGASMCSPQEGDAV